jgi:hypothetical protein
VGRAGVIYGHEAEIAVFGVRLPDEPLEPSPATGSTSSGTDGRGVAGRLEGRSAMRDALDRWSWPLRRWVCDRLVGDNAYTKNTAPLWGIGDVVRNEQTGETYRVQTSSTGNPIRFKPFDQEYS